MAVRREGPETGPAAADPLDLDDRPLLHPVGGERDLIFFGLGVARVARHLVHWRSEQPAALGGEIELVADRLGKRQSLELHSSWRIERDDRAAFGFEPQRLNSGEL